MITTTSIGDVDLHTSLTLPGFTTRGYSSEEPPCYHVNQMSHRKYLANLMGDEYRYLILLIHCLASPVDKRFFRDMFCAHVAEDAKLVYNNVCYHGRENVATHLWPFADELQRDDNKYTIQINYSEDFWYLWIRSLADRLVAWSISLTVKHGKITATELVYDDQSHVAEAMQDSLYNELMHPNHLNIVLSKPHLGKSCLINMLGQFLSDHEYKSLTLDARKKEDRMAISKLYTLALCDYDAILIDNVDALCRYSTGQVWESKATLYSQLDHLAERCHTRIIGTANLSKPSRTSYSMYADELKDIEAIPYFRATVRVPSAIGIQESIYGHDIRGMIEIYLRKETVYVPINTNDTQE